MTLKELCEQMRSTTDYVLPLKSYVMVAIDGHSFSKLIKKKFDLPFDNKFVWYMNETAKYVCKKVQGCKLAYTQSDEITFVITDFDSGNGEESENTAYFGNRLTKLLSIIPSMASAKFNQLVFADICDKAIATGTELRETIENTNVVDFDAKAWSVDSIKDVWRYLMWRQRDCIRNSKGQTAQTYLSHNQLIFLSADEQIEKLKKEKGIDWNSFPPELKYGRFIYKEEVEFNNIETGEIYFRSQFLVHPAPVIADNFQGFLDLGVVPIKDGDDYNNEKSSLD